MYLCVLIIVLGSSLVSSFGIAKDRDIILCLKAKRKSLSMAK
jgi:hypothetical protein